LNIQIKSTFFTFGLSFLQIFMCECMCVKCLLAVVVLNIFSHFDIYKSILCSIISIAVEYFRVEVISYM